MKHIEIILSLLLASARVSDSFMTNHRQNPLGITTSRTTLPRLFAEFLKQLPDESDAEYMKRLRSIAGDPEAFERAVRGDKSDKSGKASLPKDSNGSNWYPTSLHSSAPQNHKHLSQSDKSIDGSSNKNTTKGYQRVEDWEHDQQQMLKDMTWEQRVKYEGQRDGNRFNQNEILRNSLKRW